MARLDFEKPILELEGKIQELRNVSSDELNINEEIQRVQQKIEKLLTQIYSKLTPAQKVKVARHENRPHFSSYIEKLIDDFTPLAGDRLYGEDHALIGGIGRFRGQACIVMGHEKGGTTEERIKHNFGMARPEGYRKAQRLMDMAEHYGLPVLSFVDTAGAYPGVGAEERGQSEAIAKSINRCLTLKTPFLSVIIGEGGSGGAIAIAAADRVFMLEHSIYSVISPEGCASILWRSADYAGEAAQTLKLTAQDLLGFGLIDEIINEPVGGAHRYKNEAINNVGAVLETNLSSLMQKNGETLVKERQDKFVAMPDI